MFKWTDLPEKNLQYLKDTITSRPVLTFFDINKDVTIQTDASKDGIGSCLLQDGHPILFVSIVMIYAQIEKELLAVVFATEKCINLYTEESLLLIRIISLFQIL